MYSKKLIFAIIILTIAIGSVSASDLNTTDDCFQNAIEGEIIAETDDGTFESLQNKILNANEGDTIYLENDYIYDDFNENTGIEIKKSITIDGKGHTIDGNYETRIFDISNVESVVFKNINFINANDGYTYYQEGGAILSSAQSLEVIDCNFTSNSGWHGGAICAYTSTMKVTNCNFNENIGTCNGGSIYFMGDSGYISNCNFFNGHIDNGGAIFIHNSDAIIDACRFYNNFAWYGGGALYTFNSNVNVSRSNFANNYIWPDEEVYDGGAIYQEGGNMNVNYCNFTSNNATRNGGAIFSDYENSVKNSIFTQNKAVNGGATYEVNVKDSTFLANTAELGGAMYSGSADNCLFDGNSLPVTYESEITNSNIIKQKAYLTITKKGSEYGNVVLTFTLKTSDMALAGEEIVLKFSNEKIVTVKTNDNGVATYSIPFAPGTYSVSAIPLGADYDYMTEKLNGIKIEKASATITPTKLTTTYASGKNFQVKLVNSKTKATIANVKLTLKVYTGKKYKTVTVKTDSKGIAKYSASTLSIGTHKIVVSIKDTKYVSAASKTSSVKVTKATYLITAPQVTNGYKQTGTFKVVVKNKASGKAIKGVQLTLKVYTGKKYKTVNVKTNSKGEASISTKTLTKTTHKVVISAKATTNYLSASKSSSIKIIKAKIKTQFEFVDMYYNYYNNGALKSVSIKLNLIDANGKILHKAIKGQIFREYLGQYESYGDVSTGTSGNYIEVYKDIGSWTFLVQVDFVGDSTYESAKYVRYLS